MLCFIHDDILFQTQDWGIVLKHIFEKDEKIGLLGIAGAKSKTKSPSVWWLCPGNHKYFHLIQHSINKKTVKWDSGFDTNSIAEVVVVDGVFMVLRKQKDLFFSNKLNGFHNYDLNISFEVFNRKFKIVVTNEILIEHFSSGSVNGDWIESAYEIHKLYKNKLPLFIDDEKNDNKQEIANAIWFIKESLKFKKYHIALMVWGELFFLNPLLLFHIIYWKNNFKNNAKLFIQYFRKKQRIVLSKNKYTEL